MQSNIILSKSLPKAANANLKETANIFLEMEQLGIDPAPFLEIAAHDLVNQYGSIALDYSLYIEQDFKEDGDTEAAEIWQKISCCLVELAEHGNMRAH